MAEIVKFACEVCGNTNNLKRCSNCRNVFYCSKDHQSKDWKLHKVRCRSVERANCNAGNIFAVAKEKNDPASTVTVGPTLTVTDECEGDAHILPSTDECEGDADIFPSTAVDTFDKRPLNLFNPEKMEFTSLNIVEYIFKQLAMQGFCVVDGFHKEKCCAHALNEIINIEQSGVLNDGQLAGGKTSSQKSEMKIQKGIRSDKILWLQGYESEYPGISEVMSTHDAIVGGLNTYLGDKYKFEGRTKVMVACYPGNGTFYGRHVDNPNKDGRCITCMLYLNPDWNAEEDGGVLRIFPEGGDYVDIAPVMNRMLLFWSDRRNPHEVRPAYKHRYAITTWYFDKVERELAKKEQVNEEAESIQEKISQLELKTKQVEKDVIEQKIHNEADTAVSLLSREELEALGVLVHSHPDPGALLTSMGLAPSIQSALLASITNLGKG